jgi:CubicO group peptidase (beta-lactamase class C family)
METMSLLTAPPSTEHPIDEIIGIPSYFSLGFIRPGPETAFGSTPRAFGTPGAGGSFGFADPDAHLGYAYVMNKLDFWLIDDPREKALRDALYRATGRIGARRAVGAKNRSY